MSCATTPSDSVCPCGTPTFPLVICNSPNLPSIPYRVGDFLAFRYALLQPQNGEIALTDWRPGAQGDLAVQMIEWWAYLADILTFYNERIANENYLGTALLPESVNHLVQLLGYRPRPALGARGMLAGLLTPSARSPVTLPQGLQVQSKPGPGQQPQIFELDSQAALQAPDVVSADVVPASAPLLGSNADGSSYVWLSGKVSGIKQGDRLLLINAQALTTQTIADYAWITVSGTASQSDPLGNPVTQVNFKPVISTIASGAPANQYTLLRGSQSSPLWSYPHSPPVISIANGGTTIELASIARALVPGSLLMLDVSGAARSAAIAAAQSTVGTTAKAAAAALAAVATPRIVLTNSEVVWYANGQGPGPPPASSPPNSVPAIAIPHAQITVASLSDSALWNANAAQVTVRWGWTALGTLAPVLTAAALTYTGGTTALVPASGEPAFAPTPASVLLEDPAGNAASTTTNSAATPPGAITLGTLSPLPASSLASPIDVFFNLLPFSRGKTVTSEVLGSGNPSVAGQDFALQNAPVTYFADTASVSGNGFTSTVKVSVNGVLWSEMQSFYGQPPNAQVFVLREDDSGQTRVTFGDGVNGALLPTGTNNVTATYRYGAGAAAPSAETLTVIQTPQPGLQGVRNPLPPTGGNDPDSPALLTTLAPQSVLTFNRAVSLDDYVAIALTAGVTDAVASFAFDTLSQRPVVTLCIAGDAGATAAVQAALTGITVPNQGLNITTANGIQIALSLNYLRDPKYGDATVQSGITTALIDPNVGLLGANVIGIGEAIYDSQIEKACLGVPGVVAVHNVQLTSMVRKFPLQHWIVSRFPILGIAPVPSGCGGHRHDPGSGNYFVLSSANLSLLGNPTP